MSDGSGPPRILRLAGLLLLVAVMLWCAVWLIQQIFVWLIVIAVVVAVVVVVVWIVRRRGRW
jgi:hypothetical protein